ACEILLDDGSADDQHRIPCERREPRPQRLSLALVDMGSVNHHELALVLLGRQRNLEAKSTHLLLQVVRVRAHHRPENTRAAADLRRSQAALAGTARAFLLVGLFGGTSDFTDPLSLMSTGTTPGQLPNDHASENVAADRKPENPIGEFDVADLLIVDIANG